MCADHLEARTLFTDHLAPVLRNKNVVVAPAVISGMARAEQFRQVLEKKLGKPVASAFLQNDANRDFVNHNSMVGDTEGKTVVILVDSFANGDHTYRMANACWRNGASEIIAVASHSLFTKEANEKLVSADINRILVTNTIPAFRVSSPLLRDRLKVVDTAPLFAEAIKCINQGGSTALLTPS